MAVTQALYQTAHLAIVIFYTLFCAAVLGLEHPIRRFVASLAALVPVVWGVWLLSYARVPVATLEERVKEEMSHQTTGPRYQRLTAEMVALCREAREMDRVSSEISAGSIDPDEGYRRLGRIEHRMKQRIESMGEVARR